MKKTIIPVTIVLLLTIISSTSISLGQNVKVTDKTNQGTSVTYKDGIYEGKSQAKYTREPYWGSVHLTLKNGLFTRVDFIIRDSNLHETFNEKYEKHFEGNPEYIQQSRNDWNGAQTYPKKLKEKQDINKVDVISGATWSYNIFKAAVNEALKNAK